MAMRWIPTKQELFNRTPFFVTVLGYLFCLIILLGAASTFLIRSDLYSKGTLSLLPHTESIVLDTDSVVTGNLVEAGASVGEGERVLKILDDPASVALSRLRKSLDQNLSVLPEELDGFRQSAQRLREEMPEFREPKPLDSPMAGTLIAVVSVGPGVSTGSVLVPSGQPLFTVASIDEVSLEIHISPRVLPAIAVGETLSLLLPDWDPETIAARVAAIESTLTLRIPQSEFDQEFRDSIESGAGTPVSLSGKTIQSDLRLEGEEVVCRVSASDLSEEAAVEWKLNDEIALTFAKLGSRQVDATFSAIDSSLMTTVGGESLPGAMRMELEEGLLVGRTRFPGPECWARVGTQRLFDRLFEK